MIGAVYTEQDLMDTPSKNGLDGTAPHIAAQLRSLALPIDDVHADPANARVHDRRNLDAIKASMAKFGQRSPLVVQRQGMVVRAGNGRLIAARELGWDQIAAVVVDEDDVSATSYAIADNRTGELATWDDEALAGLLRSMESEMLVASGFTDEELGELCGIPKDLGDVTEDEAPEPPAEPVTKVGDLWALGRHRVLCGDSTKADDVARCLGGAEPFLMVTDPPYGVDYAALVKSRGNQKKGGWADIENDALDVDDLEALLTAALACPSAKVAFVWHPPGCQAVGILAGAGDKRLAHLAGDCVGEERTRVRSRRLPVETRAVHVRQARGRRTARGPDPDHAVGDRQAGEREPPD